MRSPRPPPGSDLAAQVRAALREAKGAIDGVLADAAADLDDELRAAVAALYRDARMAIAVLDEDEPALAALARARVTALGAALAVNAALASAYQERRAPARRVLAACYAVARLVAQLHAIAPPAPVWN